MSTAADGTLVEESCVRLFISVDLVGSTEFKNRADQNLNGYSGFGPPWASTFKAFYNGFPKVFEQPVGKPQALTLESRLRPRLIKIIGDEVFMQTRIEGSTDALEVVRFLGKALVHYKEKNLPEPAIHLKATAWIAGFPIINHRIQLEEEGGNLGGEDFIGPSIDTGFRISKWSSPNQMTVAVDLALLLLSAGAATIDPPELYFDGAKPLKGVLGGRPYPHIWMKIDGDGARLHTSELSLMHRRPNASDLTNYCNEYLAACEKTWLIRPYFGSDPAFSVKPGWHETLLANWKMMDRRNAAGDESA